MPRRSCCRMPCRFNQGSSHQLHQLHFTLISGLLLLLTPPQCTAASSFFVGALTDAVAQGAAVSAAAQSPFAAEKHLTLVFPLQPLAKAPSPPPAYQKSQMRQWEWLGGPGYFLITKSDYGLLGVLTEAWYLPGQYRPKCSSKEGVFYSAQRLWVNMEISRQIGREVWGFPKEMANIQWGPRSIKVTDPNGKPIFSAYLSAPLDKPTPSWLTTIANTGLDTIQWPIQDKNISVTASGLIDIQVSGGPKSRADAFIASRILPSPFISVSASKGTAANVSVPNTQHLGFNGSASGAIVPAPGYKQLKVVRAIKVAFDDRAFTGRAQGEVQLAKGLEVGFMTGTPGSLDNPVQFSC